MLRKSQGSIHLFRVGGIDVFLHWTWFLVAVFEIWSWSGRYTSIVWNVLEYLALFAIVLLHEFGHALACRQTGGTADRIMLWPLGGVAFVNPPQRPGAILWSIAAGPLVNVALLPVLIVAASITQSFGPDAYNLTATVLRINWWLLAFNILPIYPLDGGQILRSLLWFLFGRARSLEVAAVLGLIGAVGFVCLAMWEHSSWEVLIAAYMVISCWRGLKNARALFRNERLPRRTAVACPNCGSAPPIGPLWKCTECGQSFDTFESRAVCPHCKTQYPGTVCFECRQMHPINEWAADAYSNSAVAASSSYSS